MLHYQCDQNRDVPVVLLLNWHRNIKPLRHLLTMTLSLSKFLAYFLFSFHSRWEKQGAPKIQSAKDHMCKYRDTTKI